VLRRYHEGFMPPEPVRLPDEVYQVRVSLIGCEPEIWRRLLVLPEMSLRRFSEAIQVAMGWNGSHLHEFRRGKDLFGEPDVDRDPYQITRRQDDRKVPVRKLLPRLKAEAFYTYDFADDWQHRLVLEKRLKANPATPYPLCTEGEIACPPDDCGGPRGYFRLVSRPGYNATHVSLEAINRALESRCWSARP
jgi:Plasmid pRiA4b ORF-3-like protein